MLVERFDGRPLSWEDATMDLALAAFEIKQMALFALPGNTQPSFETDEIFVTYHMQLHKVCSTIYAENEGASFRCSQTMGTSPAFNSG